MAKRRPNRAHGVLRYPAHWFTPEDLLSFIELPPFTRRWKQLGLGDVSLAALQVAIMATPRAGGVIENTGGVRKMRFAPPGWGEGKRGALRICYAYYEEVATVALALVYAKGERDDLDAEDKRVLRAYVEKVHQLLLSRSYRSRSKSETEDR